VINDVEATFGETSAGRAGDDKGKAVGGFFCVTDEGDNKDDDDTLLVDMLRVGWMRAAVC
jgi:hypothetical protein